MRKERVITFEDTKDISYLNTLFNMILANRTKAKKIAGAKKIIKENEKEIVKEVKGTYENLLSRGLTDYMIQKHVDPEHKYKFVYFLRRNKLLRAKANEQDGVDVS